MREGSELDAVERCKTLRRLLGDAATATIEGPLLDLKGVNV